MACGQQIYLSRKGKDDRNVNSQLRNPFPLMGIIIGILVVRPFKKGGVLIVGLHKARTGNKFLKSLYYASFHFICHVIFHYKG